MQAARVLRSRIASSAVPPRAQVVRVVVAGNVLHRDAVDALAAPTTHSSFRAANHVLQPVRCSHHALGSSRPLLFQ